MPTRKLAERPPCSIHGWRLESSYTTLPSIFFTRIKPTPVTAPQLKLFNHALADELGLDVKHASASTLAAIFSGNRLPAGAQPIAQGYAGHQFGHYIQLGDGRAILLGEQITPRGARLDIQLKGTGQTPYSRRGDGRAAYAPMLREYVMSEAMHALGIPSTRSLAVVTTGEWVMREQALLGAVLTRVASSHLRVGTFEYVRGDRLALQALLNYTLQRHFPDCLEADNAALALLKAVAQRQIALIVNWMRVGFIHGVMNTDNMALSGETLDYGPCAFMDTYHPNTVYSSIDSYGRYAFGNQPQIMLWNLARLADSLLPLLHPQPSQALTLAEEVLEKFVAMFEHRWLEMMCAKLGLSTFMAGDETLIGDLLSWMLKEKVDYTNTFSALTEETIAFEHPTFKAWYGRWQSRLQADERVAAQALMRQHNPVLIPRNHHMENALKAAVAGDLTLLEQFLAVLHHPYQQPANKKYLAMPQAHEVVRQTFCGT